jgi:hypothetical protein
MTLHVLVLTPYDLRRPPADASAGLGVAWGLDAAGFRWRSVQPWGPLPELDGVDAVLSWWGRPKKNSYKLVPSHIHHVYPDQRRPPRRPWEDRLEALCRERGVPFVNPLGPRLGLCHSTCLARWQRAGIPCGRSRRFTELSEVTLPYPMILRADGGAHSISDSFRVDDELAARAVLARRDRTRESPLTLAIEFVDTRGADGLYRKRRCFVVGGRVLPRQVMVSDHWLVKLKTSLAGPQAVAEDRAYRERGEEDPELVARAARALGPDILALDYARTEDGRYVFYEGNPIFGMAGLGDGARSRQYRGATGRSEEECRAEHRDFGLAVAELLERRVEEVGAGPESAAAAR